MRQNEKSLSALKYVLLALVPYSRQNLMLSFKPNRFFYELEKQSRYSQKTLRQAYYRGQTRGFIEQSSARLTQKGRIEIQPYIATRLNDNVRIMVVFDVPEQKSAARQSLRLLLKSWGFTQVQKSVWSTDMDYLAALKEVIVELDIPGCVEIYESSRLYP